MNTRSLTDGERIMNVVQEVLDELEVLQFMPHFMSQFPAELRQQYTPQLRSLLTQMYDGEHTFRELLRSPDTKPSEFNEHRDKLKTIMQQVIDVILSNGLVEQFRYFASDPAKAQAPPPPSSASISSADLTQPNPGWKRQIGTRTAVLPVSAKVSIFRKVMKELKELWSDKLKTTVEEDQIKADLKNEIAAREKKANADLKALQRELASEQNIREKEVSLREEQLVKLKDELQKLKIVSSNQRKEFESFLAEREGQANSQYNKLVDKLGQLTRNKDEELLKKEKEHFVTERDMITSRKGLENVISTVVNKYNVQMMQIRREISEIEV